MHCLYGWTVFGGAFPIDGVAAFGDAWPGAANHVKSVQVAPVRTRAYFHYEWNGELVDAFHFFAD